MAIKLRRRRRTKIIATVGPASSTPEILARLFHGGVDVFRLNFSHGTHDDHLARITTIRTLEKSVGRPIGILADVQGPKLRVGTFAGGRVTLNAGQSFRLDMSPVPGDRTRVQLPHPEIIGAAGIGTNLLVDDGKMRLRVLRVREDHLECEVMTGGTVSDRKGVNVPDVALPIPALTKKDRRDLDFALEHGVDYIGLSFVQRPEDVAEAKDIAAGRAWIMTKLEKPQALEDLDAILDLSDAVMVARGDLGVELPPEEVPLAQKRIIRAARLRGIPCVVATQMLESMITAPAPTRAEASDVATAVFDGADAVMLSAETAAGQYPYEAVNMMDTDRRARGARSRLARRDRAQPPAAGAQFGQRHRDRRPPDRPHPRRSLHRRVHRRRHDRHARRPRAAGLPGPGHHRPGRNRPPPRRRLGRSCRHRRRAAQHDRSRHPGHSAGPYRGLCPTRPGGRRDRRRAVQPARHDERAQSSARTMKGPLTCHKPSLYTSPTRLLFGVRIQPGDHL